MNVTEYQALLRAYILDLVPPQFHEDAAFLSILEQAILISKPGSLQLLSFLRAHGNDLEPFQLLRLRLLLSSPHATFLTRIGDLLSVCSSSDLPLRQRSGIRCLIDLLRVSEERLIVDSYRGKACLHAWIEWAEMISIDRNLSVDIKTLEVDLGPDIDCPVMPAAPPFVTDVTEPVLKAMDENLSDFGPRMIRNILKYLCHEVSPNASHDLVHRLRLREGELDDLMSSPDMRNNAHILNEGIGLIVVRLNENRELLEKLGVTHVNVNEVIVRVLKSEDYLLVPNIKLAEKIETLLRQASIDHCWGTE